MINTAALDATLRRFPWLLAVCGVRSGEWAELVGPRLSLIVVEYRLICAKGAAG